MGYAKIIDWMYTKRLNRLNKPPIKTIQIIIFIPHAVFVCVHGTALCVSLFRSHPCLIMLKKKKSVREAILSSQSSIDNFKPSTKNDTMHSCLLLNAAIVETLIEDSLVGSIVSFQEDAFKLYNDHAFRLEFSIHKGNQKFKRRVTQNNAGYLQELKDSEVSIAVGLRVLKNLMDKFGCHNDSWLNRLFEEQLTKFLKYYQELVVCNEGENMYEAILDKDILKRWIKDIDLRLAVAVLCLEERNFKEFSDLISANELNLNAQECA
ncbi:hypothetical protein M9H77_04523 [Catharanthus roseus]|uniref:Uncharacterized protein n=1 Tax=Catharanthus roseus TaxID=4058 RepID=A0ACC0CEH8_CATRO|nr:hypothetical protein M9H77_04523 [Catharanthus roseus]